MDCLVAGVLTDTGASSRLLDLWREGAVELVVSPLLLDALRRTLSKPRIARRYPLAVQLATDLERELREDALLVDDPLNTHRYVPNDERDDYLVALALVAGAECLVTRDRHFEGVEVRGLTITTPGRLVLLLDP